MASTIYDPIDQNQANASRTGELSELMTKVLSKSVAGGATEEWDRITTNNFDKVSNCFVKNSGWTPSTGGAPFATIGQFPGGYTYGGTSKSGKQSGLHWTPVLVLFS